MQMFSSATRVVLLILIMALCAINIATLILYPDTLFKDTFQVFSNIIIAVTSFFFGKSTEQGKTQSEPSQGGIVLEK